jgi:transcriptional regulator with XRE-family HTH domain
MLTPYQVKMARAALEWSIPDLAREAGVNPNTVKRFEGGGNVTLATVEKLKIALEKAGITLVPANGGPATIRPPASRPH